MEDPAPQDNLPALFVLSNYNIVFPKQLTPSMLLESSLMTRAPTSGGGSSALLGIVCHIGRKGYLFRELTNGLATSSFGLVGCDGMWPPNWQNTNKHSIVGFDFGHRISSNSIVNNSLDGFLSALVSIVPTPPTPSTHSTFECREYKCACVPKSS